MKNAKEKLGDKSELTYDYLLGKMWYNQEEIDNMRTKIARKSTAICDALNDTHIDSSNIWLVFLINYLKDSFNSTWGHAWLCQEIEYFLSTPTLGGWYKGNEIKRNEIYIMYLLFYLDSSIKEWIQVHPKQEIAYESLLREVWIIFYFKKNDLEELTQLEKDVKKLL